MFASDIVVERMLVIVHSTVVGSYVVCLAVNCCLSVSAWRMIV